MSRNPDRDGASKRNDAIRRLRELVDGIPVAMLTTLGIDGRLHSRPMAVQQTEFDGTLWFFTAGDSPKIDELQHHPQVNVAFVDQEGQRFVSVSGFARIVHNYQKAKELWSPLYRAWFPKGLDDPELTLLAVDVESAEYWDAGSSTLVEIAGFVKGLVTGERYQPSGHEAFRI